jgi:hypothetical protein
MDSEELVYMKLFPNAKNSKSHGFGLVTGGKTTDKIDHLVQMLQQAEEENLYLRGEVKKLSARSDHMEEQWSQFLASQKIQPTQCENCNLHNSQTQQESVEHGNKKCLPRQHQTGQQTQPDHQQSLSRQHQQQKQQSQTG